jgi:hypothetical protein
MTREAIEAIKAQIKAETSIQDVRVFNDQFSKMLVDGNPFGYNIQSPSALIEVQPTEIRQLGDGVQIYEPLNITIHIGQMELNGDGDTMDETLSIFDLRNEIFLALQEFSADTLARMYRTSEEPDYNHGNWYVWKMTFTTTFTDFGAQRPRNAATAENPTLTLTASME